MISPETRNATHNQRASELDRKDANVFPSELMGLLADFYKHFIQTSY